MTELLFPAFILFYVSAVLIVGRASKVAAERGRPSVRPLGCLFVLAWGAVAVFAAVNESYLALAVLGAVWLLVVAKAWPSSGETFRDVFSGGDRWTVHVEKRGRAAPASPVVTARVSESASQRTLLYDAFLAIEISCAPRFSFYASSRGRVAGVSPDAVPDALLIELEELARMSPDALAMCAAHRGRLRVAVVAPRLAALPEPTELGGWLQRNSAAFTDPDASFGGTSAAREADPVGSLFDRAWPDDPAALSLKKCSHWATRWGRDDDAVGWRLKG